MGTAHSKTHGKTNVMLKCLTIQLQPDLDARFNEQALLQRVKALGHYPEVDAGEEFGPYINLNFFTEQAPLLWQQLQGLLNDQLVGDWLKRVAIVACEGEQGWDDYQLLYHYDPQEKTVEL